MLTSSPHMTFTYLVMRPVVYVLAALWCIPAAVLYLVFAWVLFMAFIGPMVLAFESGNVLPLLLWVPAWVLFCLLQTAIMHARTHAVPASARRS